MPEVKITITERSAQGDLDRRKRLNLSAKALAKEAGVTVDELDAYERSAGTSNYDLGIAGKVTAALDRLEKHKA